MVLPAGQLQVVILHEHEGGADTPSSSRRRLNSTTGEAGQHTHALEHFLRLSTGELKKLVFPKQPKQVGSNACRASGGFCQMGVCGSVLYSAGVTPRRGREGVTQFHCQYM